MAMPPDSVQPAGGNGSLLVGLGLVDSWVDVCHPFDQRAVEGSTSPLGDPPLHLGDGLDQQIFEQLAGELGITHPEVEVAWVYVQAADRKRRRAVEPPIEVSAFYSS